ncbi:MAG: ATP-binding protein [Ginsengibacter sp.]
MSLILGLTATGMFVHLIRLQQPVNAKNWLILFYLGLLIWQIENMIRYSMPLEYFVTLLYRIQTVFMLIPMIALTLVAHTQYAYRFLVATHERESRIVFRISLLLSAGEFLFVAWNEFYNKGTMATTLLSGFLYSSIFTTWIIILLVRKARVLIKINPKAAKAHFLYAGINACYAAASILSLSFGFFSVPGFWSYFLLVWFGNLASIVLYIVEAAIPASFQTKITGFTFVFAASFLSITTLIIYPPIYLGDIPGRLSQQGGLFRLLIIIAIVAVMIVILMPFMLRISLTGRLKLLLEGVQAVNSGDLDTHVAEGLPDEIGSITRNFNQMTHTLRKAYQELTVHAQTLEMKVASRTDELQKSLTELQALQAQLIQAEKTAYLGQLAAGIAHEIKNPLNFINNFSEVSIELCHELEEAVKQQTPDVSYINNITTDIILNLERIHNHGQRTDAIVQGMLEHSRASKGERQPTDINALTEECLQSCYDTILAKNKTFAATLEVHFDESLSGGDKGLGKINIIKQDVSRVLSNLFSNSFYSIAEKKAQIGKAYEPTISVITRKTEVFIEDGATGRIEIKIRDNGTGIPADIVDKIFQPFFTTKPTGQGTGLGLSLSYDIIKAHGGEIKVETREGEFAEFIIHLP